MIKKVKVGNAVFGDEKIYIQSMLSVPSHDIDGNINQAKKLEEAGCEIIRAAVPSLDDCALISKLKESVSCPIVADIHFDYKIAVEAVNAGADKIRINPGNIGDSDRIKAVVSACKVKNIPIRIGVNGGSLEKEILSRYGLPTPEAMVESALNNIKLLNKFDFDDIVVSIKTSNVRNMIKAYRLMSEKCNYPLHLGVTEAGTEKMGIIKSAIGLGSLLCDGIGSTIRVSLTADPIKEVFAAKDILKAVGKYNGIEIISCPTCGRTKIDIISLANEVEKALSGINKNIKVAVMGCAVNGPGEAREADVGIAGGDGEGLIFKKGQILRKVPENALLSELLLEIENL